MKTKILFITSLLLIIGCSKKNPINIDLLKSSKDHLMYYSRETNEPYTGPVFYLDNNDNIFLKGNIKNGEKDGDWIYWDRYGNKLEGIVSKPVPPNFTGIVFDFYYYEDSIYVTHISFEKGIMEGIYTVYLDQRDDDLKSREKNIRSIREEGTFENGVREGPYTWDFEFGKNKGDRVEGTYENGVKEGPSVYYFSNGNREERTFENDAREGPSVYYFYDGNREERTYENGVREGPYVFYSSDTGKFKGDREEGTYKNDVREGPSVYYSSNGNREERTYENHVKEGPYVYYFSNGDREEGTYENGVREGPYVYYFSSGRRVEGTYKNGKKS